MVLGVAIFFHCADTAHTSAYEKKACGLRRYACAIVVNDTVHGDVAIPDAELSAASRAAAALRHAAFNVAWTLDCFR